MNKLWALAGVVGLGILGYFVYDGMRQAKAAKQISKEKIIADNFSLRHSLKEESDAWTHTPTKEFLGLQNEHQSLVNTQQNSFSIYDDVWWVDTGLTESIINLVLVVGLGYVAIKYVIPELSGGSAPSFDLSNLSSLLPKASAAPAPIVEETPKKKSWGGKRGKGKSEEEAVISEVADVVPEADAKDEEEKGGGEEEEEKSSKKKSKFVETELFFFHTA